MACDRHHPGLSESGIVRKKICKFSDHRPWHHHFREHVPRHSGGSQKDVIEVTRHGIQQLRGGSHGIFADHLSCQHISQQVRNEKQFRSMFHRRKPGTCLTEHLEDTVERQYLDAGPCVKIFFRNNGIQVLRSPVRI